MSLLIHPSHNNSTNMSFTFIFAMFSVPFSLSDAHTYAF